jgi:transcriptional antiterminator RfaH
LTENRRCRSSRNAILVLCAHLAAARGLRFGKVFAIDQTSSEHQDSPKVAKLVTIEVSQEQALKVLLAVNVGKLSLILRQASEVAVVPQSRGRIQAAGFDTFLPMLQGKHVARPLFPGYVFAFVVQQWRVLNSTFGVLAVVRTGDCPCRMPDAEIEALKSMVVRGFVRLPEAPSKPARRKIAIGSRVKIISGPFGGLAGLYQGQTTRERELVLLRVLGGQRSVAIASVAIEPPEF